MRAVATIEHHTPPRTLRARRSLVDVAVPHPLVDCTDYVYDAGGRRTEKWFPNGVNAQYTWNKDNTLAKVKNRIDYSDSFILSQHDSRYNGVTKAGKMMFFLSRILTAQENMVRTNLQEILHPPELQGAEKRRYWMSVAAWFGLFLGSAIALISIIWLVVLMLQNAFGDAYMKAYEGWVLGSALTCIVLAFLISNKLWGVLFVKSGYLSPAAVIRIGTNRAPTGGGERIHRRISLSLSVLIPIALVWVGWYLKSWLMMGLMFLLGVWLFWSIWAGWKSADALVAGSLELPADLEHRLMHSLDKSIEGQGAERSTETTPKPNSKKR